MLTKFLLLCIKCYQVISPLAGKCCRFQPSCSTYAKQALQSTSLPHALKLIFKRLIKCHPWGPFGFDPIPKTNK